jgi:tRNA 2-thiouridine synthesizing protein B
MILHIINKSPFSHSSFADCLKLCSKQRCSILFIEDGVYAAQANTQYSQQLLDHPSITFYALDIDINSRGISHSLCDRVNTVTNDQFVELATTHQSVNSWY